MRAQRLLILLIGLTALGAAVVTSSMSAFSAIPPPDSGPGTWMRWSQGTNPQGTREEFMRVRFSCMRQAQKQVSVAVENGSRGAAISTQCTDAGLFKACMHSLGWEESLIGFKAPPASQISLCN